MPVGTSLPGLTEKWCPCRFLYLVQASGIQNSSVRSCNTGPEETQDWPAVLLAASKSRKRKAELALVDRPAAHEAGSSFNYGALDRGSQVGPSAPAIFC